MTEANHEKFSELFSRLEKATSALEEIVQKHDSSSTSSPSNAATNVSGAAASSAKSIGAVSASGSDLEASEPQSVKAFDEFLELYVDPFTSLSEELDPLVGKGAQLLSKAFQFQKRFISVASKSKKPDFTNPKSVELISPLQETIAEINDFKDSNRRSEYFAHLNAIGEGTGVLSWFLTETPVSYIPDIKDSAIFWTNKVLKEFKEKDSRNVEWVKQYLGIFDGLKLYVKQYHTTGLTYCASGDDFATNLANYQTSTSTSVSSVPATPAASSGGPPPPPPPPPPADIFESAPSSSTSASAPSGGINAVFSELNQGEGITKSLKKVDKSQMTHKNPELRNDPAPTASRTPSSGKKSPPIPKKPHNLSLKPKPEPVIELQDSKWIIKNVENKHDIVIDGEITQSVFIGNSNEVTVQIKGKVNAVSLTSTNKTALVVDSLVSGIDIVNSKKFGIQIIEKVPQISIDKSDEGTIYLSKTSLETEVYTSSTTSLNINVPDPNNDDFKELSVPEQFKHTFNANGQISSTIVEHAG